MARKLAVLVTGAVLLVAACTTETRTTNETSSNAPEGSAASYASAPCPNPIYGAGLDLGPEFTCGYLTVPENRTKSDSRTIRLAVATRKATAPSPKPDPILFLTGGPGGSGLAEGPGVAKQWPPDRDVIFLDQRGALKSEPFLSCPEVDTFMEHTVELSWSAPATAEQGAAATRTCRVRLAAAGADLAAYNTTESAADVADLRIAMGSTMEHLRDLLRIRPGPADPARSPHRDPQPRPRRCSPPNVNPIETGWRAASRQFYVRQLRDMKGSAVIETMPPARLARYGELCGITLARAHARSGDAAKIAGYLGDDDTFDRALENFAVAYADQNDDDYAEFTRRRGYAAHRRRSRRLAPAGLRPPHLKRRNPRVCAGDLRLELGGLEPVPDWGRGWHPNLSTRRCARALASRPASDQHASLRGRSDGTSVRSANSAAKAMNRDTSAKLVAMPSETRTAPPVGMPTRAR